jgi:GR25 family glycosyltransferase involved in LPS biosynthesis
MKKYYLNLDDAVERNKKWLGTDFKRIPARPRRFVSPKVDKRMLSFWNFPRHSHLGRCAVFQSHIDLLEMIVRNKYDNVLICEDDAVQVKDIPTQYPKDGILYLGGFFYSKRMMCNKVITPMSFDGWNEVMDDFRILMTLSYIIPTWKVAKELLDYIYNQRRFKAIDIMFGNSPLHKYYHYPACFIESGEMSQNNRKKRKKSNQFYEWIRS